MHHAPYTLWQQWKSANTEDRGRFCQAYQTAKTENRGRFCHAYLTAEEVVQRSELWLVGVFYIGLFLL